MVDDVETVRRLQLLANMSPKLVGKSNDETAFDYDRELVRGAIFCAMCSSFEFGLRQIIHAMAFSLEIDSADLWKLNSGGIKQIESYLSGKGYLLNLFMDQNWKDAKSLADLRNLYAHSDGWSDVNWTKTEVAFFKVLGFEKMIALFQSGVVRRFMIGAPALENVANLYAKLIEQAYQEMRSANAHP